MDLNLAKEQAALQRLTAAQLRERYAEVFGEVARTNNRTWLIRRVLWRLQAKAQGDLSERARKRAEALADDAGLRTTAPKGHKPEVAEARTGAAGGGESGRDRRVPPPGSVIAREYKGQVLRVLVREGGFEFEGEVYKTLSAVARAITGSHCNGFAFFKLAGGGDA
jgi:hypothetical protein